MSTLATLSVERLAPARTGLTDSIGAVAAAYYWELRKLAAQKRTWLGVAAAGLVQIVFLISIQISRVTPGDGPYADPMGTGLRHSGLSLTPVVLKEIAYFGPAILAALVAGDIVAVEDMGGTLKTILVRSVRRGQILAVKAFAVFTYIVFALFVFGVVGVVAGVADWGFHPLASISGVRISAGHALQGLAALPAIAGARPYILVTQLHAWHGPFTTPTDWGLIGHAMWVSVLYGVPPLIAARILFRRRDVAT